MKCLTFTAINVSILFTVSAVFGQIRDENKSVAYPEGITMEYGIGNYSVKDKYISEEKYSGKLPYFQVGWVKSHDKYFYDLSFAFRHSDDVANHNVKTDIYLVRARQGFQYSVADFTLFRKDMFLFLGPSTDFFLFNNEQQIAISGFEYVTSFAMLFSAGIRATLLYPVTPGISLESRLNATVASMGIRMVDDEETNESPLKPLTMLKGLDLFSSLGIRYSPNSKISIGAKYFFSGANISAWDPLRSASDNVAIQLTFDF